MLFRSVIHYQGNIQKYKNNNYCLFIDKINQIQCSSKIRKNKSKLKICNNQNIKIYPIKKKAATKSKYEINFLSILKDHDKTFYFPRVNGNELEVCPYYAGCEFVKSDFNIFEPKTDSVPTKVLDLVIVPALMADSRGYRLGYGKGFYDRFLVQYGQYFKSITAIPKELYVNELPIDEYDQKIDKVIITR